MSTVKDVDPITLSVVRGVLVTTQREMTVTVEKTARSTVFNQARDYSTTLFDAKPEMILQGQDIPIHLGSLIPAMKSVAKFFEGDINEGDLILHNDPAYGGSHIVDTCFYYPVFYHGELVFWTVCKGHLTDMGGPMPASYNPEAKEIYAEGLRIPPVKIWERGKPRADVLNLIMENIRARRDQEGDFKALIGACQVGARNLINILDKYGKETVMDCIDVLMDMADKQMRSIMATVPDGIYTGTAVLEDTGHGNGELAITAEVTIKDDNCHIKIDSPPQVPYYVNSYEGNSYSGIYLGMMMFAQLPPPYNEGLYRCLTVDMGPKGTLCNATIPAPHVNCTTTPMETLTDAVRLAFEKAVPDSVQASWGHTTGCNIAGWDTRHDEEYVTMVLATLISGAGATPKQDGWHACGPQACFGALSSGDIEILEHSYPIVIDRYTLMEDSGGAGKFRGGSGTLWEVEPLDREMTFITMGEGRQNPAMGAGGAHSAMLEPKLGKFGVIRDGEFTVMSEKNVIDSIKPGERALFMNPGGGGFGNPFERDINKVVQDLRDGLVSVEGAKADYGVVISDPENLVVDEAATTELRNNPATMQSAG